MSRTRQSPDVVVVGGGAIGVCAAYELARRGAAVTLLERGGELAWGCSAGNAGLITPSHATPLASPEALREGLRWLWRPDSPFYLRPRPAVLPWLARFVRASTPERVRASTPVIRALAAASLAQHVELAAAGLDTGLERRGTLSVYEAEEAFAHARAEAAESARAGARAEVLDPAVARELEPSLAADIAGAILHPDDAHCDPLRFVHAVGAAAAEAGAAIRTRVEVLGLRRSAGRVDAVVTTTGDVAAGEVVLAAGVWTPVLARPLGLYVPVEGGKGYHVDFEAADGDPGLPTWFDEARVIATPLPGRLRLAGTLELAGLDLSVDRRRVDAIVRAGQRGLRGLEGRRVLEVWRGLRPCTPDGLPIVGRPPAYENLALATGHAMMGLTLAPVTGRLVAELLTGDEPSQDVRPLRPERFQPLLGRD
ncbi:MAG: FAD-dependent oxidoreductase [Thermoleophilia bacterium]|nr:FAD-dependent oxidoreductase [Thermoleophilia bacterium]